MEKGFPAAMPLGLAAFCLKLHRFSFKFMDHLRSWPSLKTQPAPDKEKRKILH